MNGISFVISKSCCPVYNFGISNKINYGTSKKMDLIPCRLPNMQRQRISPFEATKPMLRHRVSAGTVGTIGSTICTYGSTLAKAWEVVVKFISTMVWKEGVLKLNVCYYIFLGVAAVCVARVYYGNMMSGLALLHNGSFQLGDEIKVGHVEGRVIEFGLTTVSLLNASLLTEEKRRTEVPLSWLNGQDIVNKSLYPSDSMVTDIYVSLDKIEKVPQISKEIRKMMRSYSLIYLKEEQPFCYLSGVEPDSAKITLGCNLKEVCSSDIIDAQHDIIDQSLEIIEKHGATLE